MLEESKQVNLGVLYNSFLSQLKPEEAHGYREFIEELKAAQNPQPDFKQGISMIRISKNCKAIFAEYLDEMICKISKKFFSTLFIFIKLYKDYMNLYGWKIIGKYKTVTTEEHSLLFTNIQDAEHVPEGSNDFLRNYLMKECPTFDKDIATDLTYHLCQWLKLKNYTHTTIAPTNQILC